jgi:hypothetical protein
MSWLSRTEIAGVISATLAAHDLPFDQLGELAYVVRLGGARTEVAVRLVVGDHSLHVEAFFAQRPDHDVAAFYRFLLERNGQMQGVHFAIDAAGDAYLIGRLPLLAVTPDEIISLLTQVLATAADTAEGATALGYAVSVQPGAGGIVTAVLELGSPADADAEVGADVGAAAGAGAGAGARRSAGRHRRAAS